MIRVKGVFWLNIQKKWEKNGMDQLKNAIASLSPEDQAVFSKPIIAISWVDYGAVMRLLMTIHKGDIEAIKEGTVQAARDNLRGIYKMFLSMTSPRFICNKLPLLWKQYFDSGVLSVEWMAENHATVRITGVEGMPKYHEFNFVPFVEEALRIAGAKNVFSYHLKCLARGDECCHLEFRWT